MRNVLRTYGRDMAQRAVARARPDLAVVPLRRLRDARLREVAGALHAAATGAVTDDERSWVDRIEAVRDRTVTRTATVPDGERDAIPHEHGESRTVGAIAREESQPADAALVLLKLVRAWRPTFAVELGTGTGISSAYLAAGLAMNGRGRLVTIERSPTLAEVARSNVAALGLDNVDVVVGGFDDALPPVLERGRADFAFVDGPPEFKPTLWYFDLLFAAIAEDALCVLDEIDWSDDMALAWRRISRHDPVEWSTSHGRLGICRAHG